MSTAFDDIADGAIAPVTSGALNNVTDPVTITTGTGWAAFPTVINGYYVDVWDTSYPNPLDDPNREVCRVTVHGTGNSFTLARGQLGTTAKAHSTANVVIQLNAKAYMWQALYTAVNNIENGGTGASYPSSFRLTLVTGVPAPEDSGFSATTLYLTPYTGNAIYLYDGTKWNKHNSAEISLSTSALSDGVYDVWVYNVGGTLTLGVSTIWSDPYTRVDTITQQDGVWVKSSDHTKRLAGTIQTTSGAVIDSFLFGRQLWNADNRLPRDFRSQVASYTTSSNSPGVVISFPIVVGVVYEPIEAWFNCVMEGNTGSSAACEIFFGQQGAGPDVTYSPSVALQEKGPACLAYSAQPVTQGGGSVDTYCQSSVNLVAVNLVQEDVTYPGVWLTGTMWG